VFHCYTPIFSSVLQANLVCVMLVIHCDGIHIERFLVDDFGRL